MELGIKLFSSITFDKGQDYNDLVPTLNRELALEGYTLSKNLMDQLGKLSPTDFQTIRATLLQTISKITGSGDTHRMLFSKFPYETPDEHTYLENRILGYIANHFDISLGDNKPIILNCGHSIDSSLFDLEDFGACPICQRVDPQTDIARYPLASIPLRVINYVEDFSKQGSDILSRKSSLSGDEKAFILDLIQQGKVLEVRGDLYKENLPYAYIIGGVNAVRDHISGATDIMRIATLLSDPTADISLKDNTRYRISTRHKKALLGLLNDVKNLEEDMMRHRERWLRLGEVIAMGSEKNRKRYPRVAKAIDTLRNDPKSIKTFGRTIERAIRDRNLDDNFFNTLKSRPTEFARRLDHLMQIGDPLTVTNQFAQISHEIKTLALITLKKYFQTRDQDTHRAFFPKGQINKVQIVPNNRKPFDPKVVDDLVSVIDQTLKNRFNSNGRVGIEPVYIDPALREIMIPQNRRGDSSTSIAITKGSRLPIESDIARFFIWWNNGEHGRVDVDLSALYMDEQFNTVGHVAFTRLSHGSDVIHSGDIQDAPAPKGASEFIDVDLKKISTTARYMAISVISYTGQDFSTFPCYAGFMERDSMRSGRVYEPATVSMKMDVNSPNTSATPMLIDLKERKVIFSDISGSKSRYGAVINQGAKFSVLTRMIITMADRKPTLHDYLEYRFPNVVAERSEAEVAFGPDDTGAILELINSECDTLTY